MARHHRVVVKVRTTEVVRDTDDETVLLVEGWCGDSDTPILMQVVDPSREEDVEPNA